MKFIAPTLLFYLSFLLDDISQTRVNALRISGKRIPRGEDEHGLGRRATLTADLRDDSDLKYYTNITLNEEVFPVLIDTGRYVIMFLCKDLQPFSQHCHNIVSSDLYIAGDVGGAGNTGKTANVQYAIGAAAGALSLVHPSLSRVSCYV